MREFWRFVLSLAAASCSLLYAQGTKTREDAAKYNAHSIVGEIGLGADFWGHSIPLANGAALKTNHYLVVEVALFAPPTTKVAIRADQFVLKIDGQTLLPESPGLITVGSIIPDMRERGPRLETDAGVGPVTVATGRDPRQQKFPGDSNPADIPLPPRSQTPDGGLQNDPADPVTAVRDASLPEGSHATPISGYLFYAFPGKLKRIKHAEIQYTNSTGTATLSLR